MANFGTKYVRKCNVTSEAIYCTPSNVYFFLSPESIVLVPEEYRFADMDEGTPINPSP
jgi:hypothetical protein